MNLTSAFNIEGETEFRDGWETARQELEDFLEYNTSLKPATNCYEKGYDRFWALVLEPSNSDLLFEIKHLDR